MKKTILATFSVLAALAVMMVSCGGASTPKASLKILSTVYRMHTV